MRRSSYQGSFEGMYKRCSSGNSVLMDELVVLEGNVVMSLARMRDLFLLGVENSRSYS
jgi:hypothetical protein